MVSSLRNRGTMFQELRYPKTGTAVQSGQDSSICKGLSKEELDFIINIDNHTLTESEKVFVDIVKDYYEYYKEHNNKRIRNVLSEITKTGIEIKDDYRTGKKGRHSQTAHYAYALNVPTELFPSRPFIKTVDYTALGNLEICIYAGLIVKYSRPFVEYIKAHNDFWDRIKCLVANGWSCTLEYRIGDRSGYTNKEEHILGRIIYEINEDSTIDGAQKFIEEINDDAIGVIPKDVTIACIQRLKKFKGVKEINEGKQEGHFANSDDKVCSVVCLSLIYAINNEGSREEKLPEMKTIYKRKTIEGLDAFDLGEAFSTKIFK